MRISQERVQISILMYYLIQKVKISLQMAKFPGNDIPKFPIFSNHD